MALANVSYTANGSTTTFVVSFGYLQASHITVTLDTVVTAAYTFDGSGNIVMDVAPTNGVILKIQRDSDITQKLVAFADGSNLTEEDLNNDASQGIFLQQETRDNIDDINSVNAGVDARITVNETDIDALELEQLEKVNGAATATDNSVMRHNGTTGKISQDSGIIIDDSDAITGIASLNTHTLPAGTGTLALTTDTAPSALKVQFEARIDETGGLVIGDVVYINGATGQKMEASKAINDDYTKVEAIAICTMAGSDNATVRFQNFGEIGSLDTSAWADGDILYLDSTAGGLTNIHPTGIQGVMRVARVVSSHASNGIIFVHIVHQSLAADNNGIVRVSVANTSTGTGASAAFTAINDASHRVSVSMTSSNFSAVAGIAESLIIYNEGYNKTVNAVDGNFGFEWWTDVTDSHDLSSTAKMALSAAGQLDVVSLDVGSSTVITGVLDEDDLVSNSATKLATQQSIKAHVAAEIVTHESDTSVHGVTTVAGISEAQVITNKDIDGGIASDTNRITLPSADKVTLDALTRKEGTIVYDSSGNKMYADDGTTLNEIGSGGGSGGINYITGTNTDAEVDIGDWVTYLDTAGVNPVNGVDGTSVVTFAVNATTPMRGAQDFKMVKDAANRQGSGASVPFTIDLADKAQMLTISFDYDASHAGYADDDIRISVYDVTNSKLIRINGEDLKGGKGSHIAQFQTSSDSVSYRLIMHVSSTSAVAYDLYFDNIQVGPKSTGVGGATADSMVRLHTGNGHGSTNTKIRRFTTLAQPISGNAITYADSASLGATFTIEEDGVYMMSYNDTNGGADSFLGLSLNSTQLTTNIDTITAANRLNVSYSKSNNIQPVSWSGELKKDDVIRAHTDGVANSSIASFTISKIGAIGIKSEDIGNREIVVEGAGNSGAAITAQTERIDFTVIEDTTSSWSQVDSNGLDTFTVPETGYYIISGSVNFTTSAADAVYAYIDNTLDINLSDYTNTAIHNLSGTVHLVKGQTLDIRSLTSRTLANSLTQHHIHIQKLASPQTILETATVAARYTSNSGQSLTGATVNTLKFEDLEHDTHSAYNISTGVYTVPVSGFYEITSGAAYDISISLAQRVQLQINVDGNYKAIEKDAGTGSSFAFRQIVSTGHYLEKDSEVIIAQYSEGGTSLSADNGVNFFSITRIK